MATKNSTPRFKDALHGLPIDGTGEPLPCPFCATHDTVSVLIRLDQDIGITAIATCDGCLVQAPIAAAADLPAGARYLTVAQEAARLWNHRPAPAARRKAA